MAITPLAIYKIYDYANFFSEVEFRMRDSTMDDLYTRSNPLIKSHNIKNHILSFYAMWKSPILGRTRNSFHLTTQINS